jgi:hypothetical protein
MLIEVYFMNFHTFYEYSQLGQGISFGHIN